MMTNLEALISRLESATEPDRELANDMLFECGWMLKEVGNNLCDPALEWESPAGENFCDGDQPNPLVSFDAALGLVPEGFSHGHKTLPRYSTKAEVGTHEAVGATPAIALCIAALRARLADQGKTNSMSACHPNCKMTCCSFPQCCCFGQPFYMRADSGWWCPKCETYHAPACMTCPNHIPPVTSEVSP